MSVLPRVTSAEYRGGFRIRLTFNDGLEKTINFRRWFDRGPLFVPLRRESFFRRFTLDGGTVSWPNGADIAPETLYGAAVIGGRPFGSPLPRRRVGTKPVATAAVTRKRSRRGS